jgi:hypothetical protein
MLSDIVEDNLWYYYEGLLSRQELIRKLIELVTPTNLEEIIKLVPGNIIFDMLDRTNRSPSTNDQWNRLMTVVTRVKKLHEKIKAAKRIDCYRTGVETLRRFIVRQLAA